MIQTSDIRRIVVVGDAYVSPATMAEAARRLGFPDAGIIALMWGTDDKQRFTDDTVLIERDGPDAVAFPPGLEAEIETADIILVHFCPLPERLLQKARRLKLVGTCRGGVEHIAGSVLTQRGIPLIHIIRNAQAVAEFTIGMILAETRNIARSHHLIKSGGWPTDFPNSSHVSTLKNLTVGLVGLGNIGILVTQMLSALGARVIGYDAYMAEDAMSKLPVTPVKSMREVFAQADIVSLHLRLTDENRKIVDKSLLSLMKPSAYLVNTSRGGLINEADLCQILAEGRLSGAALDVFTDEPLPPDSPFLSLDNVTLTPHIAGDTIDSIALSPHQLADAMLKFFQGDAGRVWNKTVLKS